MSHLFRGQVSALAAGTRVVATAVRASFARPGAALERDTSVRREDRSQARISDCRGFSLLAVALVQHYCS